MAQERPDTPEKQLLKIIENPKSKGVHKDRIKRKGINLFSLGALKGRFSFLRDRLRTGLFFKKPHLEIKSINRILKICILVFSIYLVSTMTISAMNLNTIPDFASGKQSALKVEEPEDIIALRDLPYYLDKVKARNIFDFEAIDTAVEGEEYVEEKRVREIDVEIQKLRLAGIAWSDNPDAMVENIETNEMYFLKQGDLINGKLKVEAVFRNKVILSYQGDEAELQ